MKDKIIGIDLGGTTTKFAVVTDSGDIVEKWAIDTDVSNEGSRIVPNMITSIKEKLNDLDLSTDDFIGIGMGSPGSVNRSEGTVTGAFNLNWRSKQEIKKQVEDELKLDFYLDNDANVAALGEQWKGAGNQNPNVVFITLGTGVGGGIVVDANLAHGANDTAGEIGHMTVANDRFNFPCTCGKSGCLESLASATGIVNIAKQLISEFEGSSSLVDLYEKEGKVEAKDVFNEAKAGDDLALEIVDIVCDYLAFAAGNLANVLNPSVVVIGGGVSKAGAILTDTIEKHMEKYLFPPLKEHTRVRIAQLESDAGVIGASSLVLRENKSQ